jgi:hypothetical protein
MRKSLRTAAGIVFTAIMFAVLVAQGEAAHRVTAALVDQESSLHTSVSNRDVYRLRIMPRKGASFEAVAIDSYPSYAEVLSLRGLAKDATFSIRLVRTPYCDEISGTDGKGALVRCFAIERSGLKVPRNAVVDPWWK